MKPNTAFVGRPSRVDKSRMAKKARYRTPVPSTRSTRLSGMTYSVGDFGMTTGSDADCFRICTPAGSTSRAVTKISRFTLTLRSDVLRKNMPMSGKSPRSGTLSLIFRMSSVISPPMTTVAPS